MKWIKWEEDLDAFIMWVYGPAGAGKSAIGSNHHGDVRGRDDFTRKLAS